MKIMQLERSLVVKHNLPLDRIGFLNRSEYCGLSECKSVDSCYENTKIYETNCGVKVEKFLDNDFSAKTCTACKRPIKDTTNER